MTATTWEPGDPLYRRSENGGASYRAGLYNFRDDPDLPDACMCPDAASWPDPRGSRPLPEGDELADFIRHWRWWQTQESP
jgi:hypothetical protein